MPPKRGTPWELQQRFADDFCEEEVLESGSESGVESADDVIADKFQGTNQTTVAILLAIK